MLKKINEVMNTFETIPAVKALQVVDYTLHIYFDFDKSRELDTYVDCANGIVTLVANPREYLNTRCTFESDRVLVIKLEWS